MRVSGISTGFPVLSRSSGQVAHVLRTRSPLSTRASPGFTFDLHVLSAPPAFVLSQDQTLREDWFAHIVRSPDEPASRAGQSSLRNNEIMQIQKSSTTTTSARAMVDPPRRLVTTTKHANSELGSSHPLRDVATTVRNAVRSVVKKASEPPHRTVSSNKGE